MYEADISIAPAGGLCAAVHTYAHRFVSINRVHEMSVCQALLVQVAEIARQRGAHSVCSVTIQIGLLSGIDPAQLRLAFAVMRVGSAAAAAELMIEMTAVEVRCLACGVRSATLVNRMVCRACGNFRTRVIAGDELRLLRIEIKV